MPKKRLALGQLCLALGLACSAAAARAAETVRVMYAGSLVHVMEQRVGPAFQQATGIAFQGYAGGSNALANQIKGRLRQADVFISASPKVNQGLMGAANGDWVRWYVGFAQSPLQIGYNPRSRFAAELKAKRWDQALAEPGTRIGRTDPRLDPKGAFTVQLLAQAQQVYGDATLSQRVLGGAENPAQIFPEEVLVGRLQSGQLDAGFFYSTEVAELGIPAVKLPAPFDIKASYTVTILAHAPDEQGAERFVQFLLGEEGGKLLRAAGLDVQAPAVGGDAGALPAGLKAAIGR
jgi:molybdate/tungstate transport system substrate-binding protein